MNACDYNVAYATFPEQENLFVPLAWSYGKVPPARGIFLGETFPPVEENILIVGTKVYEWLMLCRGWHQLQGLDLR